jgi:hypothetical protein
LFQRYCVGCQQDAGVPSSEKQLDQRMIRFAKILKTKTGINKMLNRKYKIILFVIIISCHANLFAQNEFNDKKIRLELVGVWQASSSVGSGMNDNFQFFADGKFQFNYNQMDGTKRIFSYGGKWKIEKGKLILTLEKISFLLGGKWVKATGSIATDYEIVGGKVFDKEIFPIEKHELILGKFIKEEYQQTTKIDGVKYWKMSSDPKTYEN